MNTLNTRGSWLMAAAAAAWLALPAAGQTHSAAGQGSSVVVSKGEGEGRHVEVRVDDGRVTVRIDGKEVPSDRVRLKDGRIVIVDEDGTERELGVYVGGGGAGHAEAWGELEPEAEHPAVMLGIHMTSPGEALAHHLGIDPEATTMVAGVHEGLPAHEAGIGQYDIVIALDGASPADPEAIRTALAGRVPGDTVTLTLIQKGVKNKVAVKLAAWDQERMDRAQVIGEIPKVAPDTAWWLPFVQERERPFEWRDYLVDPESRWFWRWEGPRLQGLEEKLREHLEEGLGKRVPGELAERLERLNKRLQEMQAMLDELIEQSRELERQAPEPEGE